MLIYVIHGPFFFGVAQKIEHALAVTHTDPKTVIFRLNEVPFMDMTGLETFYELIEQYHKRGVKIYLCEANARVARKLATVGVLCWIEEGKIFNTLNEALNDRIV